mmetsp:Transcript_8262/g.19435  ORF Transcript_8262/g.19435 Transcript_8262/m.19435 type:complete len:218 (+) Transcript_8262:340-993(+)
MYVAFVPLTLVCSAINEFVHSFAVHLVIEELALVADACGGGVGALAMFHAMLKATRILGTIYPSFHTLSRLVVQMPLSIIDTPINMLVFPLAVRSILMPSAFICIAIGCDTLANTVRLVVDKLTFIPLSIYSDSDSMSVALVSEPLTGVLCVSVNDCFLSLLQLHGPLLVHKKNAGTLHAVTGKIFLSEIWSGARWHLVHQLAISRVRFAATTNASA